MPTEVLAVSPALPLDEAGKYVAGAYIVFVVLLVVYVGIMASKLARIERELREVADVAEQRKAEGPPAAEATAAETRATAAEDEVRA